MAEHPDLKKAEKVIRAALGDRAKLKDMWNQLDYNGNGIVSVAELDKWLAVFMQYAHCMHDDFIWHDGCKNKSEPRVMGYAVRTRRWRYIEWVPINKTTFPPTIHWGKALGVELYDHTEHDTVENVAESVNLAGTMPDVEHKLSTILHSG